MTEILLTGDREVADALKRALNVLTVYSVNYCRIEDSLDKTRDYSYIFVATSPHLEEDQKLLLSAILWSALIEDNIEGAAVISGIECLDITGAEYAVLQSFVNFLSPPFELSDLQDIFTKRYSKPETILSMKLDSPLAKAMHKLNHTLSRPDQSIARIKFTNIVDQEEQSLWKTNIREVKRWYGVSESIFRSVKDVFEDEESQDIKGFLAMISRLLKFESIDHSNIQSVGEIFDDIEKSEFYGL